MCPAPGSFWPTIRVVIRNVIVGLAVGGCAVVDVEQARLCTRLIPALEAPGARIDVLEVAVDPSADLAVVVEYRRIGPAGDVADRWLSCRFAGAGLAQNRLRLTGVSTAGGPLSEIQVFMLRQYWLGLHEGRAEASPGRTAARTLVRQLLYALQLAVDGIALGSVYGLLAVGYALVYGVVGRINLAFGELAMVGAYTTFLGVTALALTGLGPLPLVLLGLLLVVAGVGAAHGLVIERLIFRPLRDLPSQAPLIATIGLAILLQEYLRLTQGAGDRWVQPVFSEAHQLAATEGFEVTISTVQMLVIAIGGGVYGALAWLMLRTGLGRNIRAIGDDGEMAALCGVDVGRTVTLTFMLGTAIAAVAGLVVLLRYGGVSFADGLLLGFKALTAAIIGGLGRVEGAMLGGVVIAMVEVFWAGYLSLAYRDVAVFGLLALFLIWRPQGLLGHPVGGVGEGFHRRPV